MTRAKILYSGFYDAPLAFVVRHRDAQFLFWRVFDEEADEYPDTYRVLTLPDLSDEEISESWQTLEGRASGYIGEAAVRDVKFDQSMRKEIDTSVIDALLDGGQ